ncbi:extracellular calcium-sensing receptor-like [Labrus mixtus]|uniref:extracellular calcium-sensing receptor-like n=1 Tax=Labrus mixtus TaxID=508554 RepID=UPI0029C07A32|nr:extracellular calcium-sensing receptor-like [Labrus mixtus]
MHYIFIFDEPCWILLLLSAVGQQTGLNVVQATVCSHWGAPTDKSLIQDGDLIIGGLFNLYHIPSTVDEDYTKKPHYEPCTGLELEPLKYSYAMVFAVEEINRNNTLLPGVKLGYHILDSCSLYPWALQGAMSLVGGDTHSCNLTAFVGPIESDEQPVVRAGT